MFFISLWLQYYLRLSLFGCSHDLTIFCLFFVFIPSRFLSSVIIRHIILKQCVLIWIVKRFFSVFDLTVLLVSLQCLALFMLYIGLLLNAVWIRFYYVTRFFSSWWSIRFTYWCLFSGNHTLTLIIQWRLIIACHLLYQALNLCYHFIIYQVSKGSIKWVFSRTK